MGDFLELLRMAPQAAHRGVFNYLSYESGPHRLRVVPNKALIACTSRTGSSLLQVALERYGLDAQEFFNPEGPPKRAVQAGKAKSIVDYANLLADTAVSGGWFAAKGALNSILYLYYLGEIPRFAEEWKFVFLRRRNVIRQAISMQIADVSGQWTATMPARRIPRPEDYCFDDLRRHIDAVFAQNDKWERAFGFLGISPYRIFYEELVANLGDEVERIARFFGVAVGQFPTARRHEPWLKPQSSVLNVEWEERFREELAARIANPPPPQL